MTMIKFLQNNKWVVIVAGILVICLLILSIVRSFFLKAIEDPSKKYETLQREDISSIPDEELVNAVMSWMWGKFNSDWSNQFAVISSLPKACRNIYSVYTIEAEVNNGGFNQCYFNSSKEFTKMPRKVS